jgi:hypothetical protein
MAGIGPEAALPVNRGWAWLRHLSHTRIRGNIFKASDKKFKMTIQKVKPIFS